MHGVSPFVEDRPESREDMHTTPMIAFDRQQKMRLWVIICALVVAIHASIAEMPRNKNRGRGSMWW